jgi:hypothetical protein
VTLLQDACCSSVSICWTHSSRHTEPRLHLLQCRGKLDDLLEHQGCSAARSDVQAQTLLQLRAGSSIYDPLTQSPCPTGRRKVAARTAAAANLIGPVEYQAARLQVS